MRLPAGSRVCRFLMPAGGWQRWRTPGAEKEKWDGDGMGWDGMGWDWGGGGWSGSIKGMNGWMRKGFQIREMVLDRSGKLGRVRGMRVISAL